MKLLLISLLLASTGSFAQRSAGFSLYLGPQFQGTIVDRTKLNNPWGIGFSLQTYFPTKSKFTPSVEFSAHAYFEDDKVYRFDEDGNGIESISGMTAIYAGTSYALTGPPKFL